MHVCMYVLLVVWAAEQGLMCSGMQRALWRTAAAIRGDSLLTRPFVSCHVCTWRSQDAGVLSQNPRKLHSLIAARSRVQPVLGMMCRRAWDKCLATRNSYSLWRWGVAYLFNDVSHKTPGVTPCRTSPPMPVFRMLLARNARCNTMSHLTAAGSTSSVCWR